MIPSGAVSFRLPGDAPGFDPPPVGTVYGVLFNDPAALAQLGEAVDQPPYKGAPKAPVLFIKPRNTFCPHGAPATIPAGVDALEIGACLGLVIGRTACRLPEAEALSVVTGYTIANDLSVPHASFFRPAIRQKCRDGFCPIGPRVVAGARMPDPDALTVRVFVDGRECQRASTAGRIRSAARLLADVTAFMTLVPGDVLLMGPSAGAPVARAGQHVTIEIDGIGRLETQLVAEPAFMETEP